MKEDGNEEQLLREVSLQNARSIFLARQRAEEELVRTREALWKQSELMRVTLASIGDAVVTTDTEGRVLSLNAVAEDLTGWTQQEAQGRPLAEVLQIINEESRQPVENPALRALQEGRVVGLANHTILIARDGTETPIDDSAAPIRDEQGQLYGAVLIFRGIAERKQAEEAQARLAAIVESSEEAIISKTLEGRIVSWNAGAAGLFGYSAEEAIGQPITLLIPPERRDEELMILERLRRGERIKHYETVRVTKQGRRIDVSLTISPVRDSVGRIVGASKISRDITGQKLAEQALRESEQQLRLALEAGGMGTWEWDIVNSKVKWSASLEAIHGLAPGAFGGTFDDFQADMHPEDRERVLQSIAETLERDKDHNIEYRIILPEGGIRWIEGRGKLFRDKAGLPTRMLGVCSDITVRKQAEQTTHFLADASATLTELTDYQSTLQRIASLAVPFFADWCAVDMREADGAVRRLAVTHTDPAKVQLAHALFRRYPPRAEDQRGLMQVLRTGNPDWLESIPDDMLVAAARDTEHLRIARELGLKSYICVPLKSRTEILGALTFVTAESGRVYNANDLRAAEDLAHRAVIAIENANLLAALKESDRRKDEFLAILAHEMRNPLAPIRNAVKILRAKGPVVPELQWARDVIDRQVNQMTRLVDDLLDVSRITRGKIELRKQRVELRAVVNDALEASRPQIEQWGHALSVELPADPIFLEADATRLTQVLLNLLNNAAKYMERGGRIWLTAAREGEQVVVRVKDTGIGIPTDMLPHIFEMFTQVDRDIARAQGGLGIGLTLVQRLVALHGGTIEARSQGPGEGSEFIVRLPVAPDSDRDAHQAVVESERLPAAPSLRVLVVDDNQDSADSMAMFLRIMGHEVRTAHDGLAAVEEAARFQPDTILLDIGLPKLNGYEAARRIRAQRGGDVLLIALTGWGQEEDRRRSQEAGFDHHLTKPVDFDQLNDLLVARGSRHSGLKS